MYSQLNHRSSRNHSEELTRTAELHRLVSDAAPKSHRAARPRYTPPILRWRHRRLRAV